MAFRLLFAFCLVLGLSSAARAAGDGMVYDPWQFEPNERLAFTCRNFTEGGIVQCAGLRCVQGRLYLLFVPENDTAERQFRFQVRAGGQSTPMTLVKASAQPYTAYLSSSPVSGRLLSALKSAATFTVGKFDFTGKGSGTAIGELERACRQ